MPKYVSDAMEMLVIPAVGTGKPGRARGGYLWLWKKSRNACDVVVDVSFPSVKWDMGGEGWMRVVGIYRGPEEGYDWWDRLDSAMRLYEKEKCLFVGDVNCWIGVGNSCVLGDCWLADEREVIDGRVNKQGRSFLRVLEDNDGVVLNGRSHSDTPAKITYASGGGSSTIDMAWVGREMVGEVLDFLVLDEVLSDHFPILVCIKDVGLVEDLGDRGEMVVEEYEG